ncbi:helix-turn-helix domain-containing protein [Halomonas sp. KO116]|uniref:helix-turn-helix domain-containing protein n=1 Tax=Halomonas sp. KO116 TaxID=1504981 RepID=UPI0004E44816|nr:LysR family transcriptional regulator [Halomonas sp. KO116]AJY53245.1 transcriptional regulator, LysR family [Halomonas sp. KO116]
MADTTHMKLANRLNKINLNLLLVFHTLYWKRSLTLTAEALCLTQPAVSHSLKKLRLLMDDPLFIKTLLDEGKLIARPADPALGHVLRITAVEDALTPGRLATLEAAIKTSR